MPTTRRRYVITETDNVAEALEAAAARWPEDRENRPRLLLRLVEQGHRSVADHQADAVAERLAAIVETAGTLTGVFGPGYLADLRADWPE